MIWKKTVDEDLCNNLKYIFPGASPEMKGFLESQRQALQASGLKQRRWDKSMIKTCLSLWSRSPKSYNKLKENNIFVLPSGNLLQRYKNAIPQNAGIQSETLRWMTNTAKKQGLPNSWYYGGLVHDDTKIQEALVLNTNGKEDKLIGWIDIGNEAQMLRVMNEKTVKTNNSTTCVTRIIFRIFWVQIPTNTLPNWRGDSI